jgi:hypothetical protein
MKRLSLSVLILLFFFIELNAQSRSRGLVDKSRETQSYLFFSAGPEFCFADPTGSPFSQSVLKNYNLSLGYRKLFPNNFGYRLEMSYLNLTGKDTVSLNNPRRYSFNTNVLKTSVIGEYSIIIGRRYYYRSTPNIIYGFLGVGFLRTNANLNYDPANPIAHYCYKKIYNCPVIPFGGGYRYNFNNGFLMGIEINYNFPFSDYIDGFKPPLNILNNGTKSVSKSNDIFGGISLTFSYLLGTQYMNRK